MSLFCSKLHSVLHYLVSIPVVRGWVDSLPLISLQQLFGIPDTHRSSDDLSDIWHQHVNLRHRPDDHTAQLEFGFLHSFNVSAIMHEYRFKAPMSKVPFSLNTSPGRVTVPFTLKQCALSSNTFPASDVM